MMRVPNGIKRGESEKYFLKREEGTGWWKQTSKRNIEVAIWNRLCIWIVDEGDWDWGWGDSYSNWINLWDASKASKQAQAPSVLHDQFLINHREWKKRGGWSDKRKIKRQTGETECEKKYYKQYWGKWIESFTASRSWRQCRATHTHTGRVYSHDSNTWADFKYLKRVELE
jgi:hypothetical protein